jgi:hypothetical protein
MLKSYSKNFSKFKKFKNFRNNFLTFHIFIQVASLKKQKNQRLSKFVMQTNKQTYN